MCISVTVNTNACLKASSLLRLPFTVSNRPLLKESIKRKRLKRSRGFIVDPPNTESVVRNRINSVEFFGLKRVSSLPALFPSASQPCFLAVCASVFPLRVLSSDCIHASHKPSCLFVLVVWQLNSSWVSRCCDPVFSDSLASLYSVLLTSQLQLRLLLFLLPPCLKVSLLSHPDSWIPKFPGRSCPLVLLRAALRFIFAA